MFAVSDGWAFSVSQSPFLYFQPPISRMMGRLEGSASGTYSTGGEVEVSPGLVPPGSYQRLGPEPPTPDASGTTHASRSRKRRWHWLMGQWNWNSSTLEMGKISAVCSVESWVAAQVMLQTGWPLLVEQLLWEALWAKTDRLPR